MRAFRKAVGPPIVKPPKDHVARQMAPFESELTSRTARIELRTNAGLIVRLELAADALSAELAREELIFLLAKNVALFPQQQQVTAMGVATTLLEGRG